MCNYPGHLVSSSVISHLQNQWNLESTLCESKGSFSSLTFLFSSGGCIDDWNIIYCEETFREVYNAQYFACIQENITTFWLVDHHLKYTSHANPVRNFCKQKLRPLSVLYITNPISVSWVPITLIMMSHFSWPSYLDCLHHAFDEAFSTSCMDWICDWKWLTGQRLKCPSQREGPKYTNPANPVRNFC